MGLEWSSVSNLCSSVRLISQIHLLAPLVLVEGGEHPAPGLASCHQDGADGGVLEGGQTLAVVDGRLVGQLVVAAGGLDELPLVVQDTALAHLGDGCKVQH